MLSLADMCITEFTTIPPLLSTTDKWIKLVTSQIGPTTVRNEISINEIWNIFPLPISAKDMAHIKTSVEIYDTLSIETTDDRGWKPHTLNYQAG